MGYPIRGLAYPNGSYSDDICNMLPAMGIRYGRIVGNSDNFAMPQDFYRWKATCHHNHRLQELGQQFAADNSFVYNPCAQSLWICVDDEEFIEVKGGEQVYL